MPGDSRLSSWVVLVPVTRGERGLALVALLKLKLSMDLERLDWGVSTGVSIGVLFSDKSWTLEILER